MFCIVVGCGVNNTARDAVEDFLNKYQMNDQRIINELEKLSDRENFNEEQRKEYIDILKEQYKTLKYEIINEEHEDGEATITVRITVRNLHRVQEDVGNYLAENPNSFNDSEGNFNNDLFLNYKLEQMKTTTYTIDYTTQFFVTRRNREWQERQPSTTVLEKIHGIYNYENR